MNITDIIYLSYIRYVQREKERERGAERAQYALRTEIKVEKSVK